MANSRSEIFAFPRYVLRPTGLDMLQEALKQGYNLLDVSKCLHKPGIGDFIQSHRDQLRVAAQFQVKPEKATGNTIKKQCKKVLSALSLNKIDFFYQKPSRMGSELPQVMAELKELVSEGLVGEIGISHTDPDKIRQAHEIHPLLAVAIPISPWNPPSRNPAVAVCRELGVNIIATKVKACGLLDLDTLDKTAMKNQAAALLAEQKDKLVKKVEKAFSQSKSRFANQAKNLLVDCSMKLASAIHLIITRQDVRFVEKISSRAGEAGSELVDDIFDLAGNQKRKLMGMLDVVVSNHLKRLTNRLGKDGVEIDMKAIVKRIMDSMSARILDRLVLLRSKQMEERLDRIKSRFGETSGINLIAAKICKNQGMALSQRLSKVQIKTKGHVMDSLVSIELNDRKTVRAITSATTDRSNYLEKNLPKTLGARWGITQHKHLTEAVRGQNESLEEKLSSSMKLCSPICISKKCRQIVTREDVTLGDKIGRTIENCSRKDEELALSIVGQQFGDGDFSESNRISLGRSVIEEGVQLNKCLQQIATDEGLALVAVTYAWLQTQGDDISCLTCVGRSMKMKLLILASELAEKEEINKVKEYVDKYENDVMSALSWVDVEKEKMVE